MYIPYNTCAGIVTQILFNKSRTGLRQMLRMLLLSCDWSILRKSETRFEHERQTACFVSYEQKASDFSTMAR